MTHSSRARLNRRLLATFAAAFSSGVFFGFFAIDFLWNHLFHMHWEVFIVYFNNTISRQTKEQIFRIKIYR